MGGTNNGDSVAVTLSGELDISTATVVEQQLLQAERARPRTMVVDLRELSFIDSTGLRLILEADARARLEGRRLMLVPGPERVHRVFLIALLDKRLDFVEEPGAVVDG